MLKDGKTQTRSTGHWPWLHWTGSLSRERLESLCLGYVPPSSGGISDKSCLREEGLILAHGFRERDHVITVGAVCGCGTWSGLGPRWLCYVMEFVAELLAGMKAGPG